MTEAQPTRWRDLVPQVRWRVAAGWVVVTILLFRYILYPIANIFVQVYGYPALAELEPISWTDVLAIVGLPVGGAYADKLKDD